MKSYSFARKRRQVKFIAKQIRKGLLATGGQWTNKLKRLSVKMKNILTGTSQIISNRGLCKALGAAAILLGLASSNPTHAQFLGPQVTNPFNLTPIPAFVPSTFADLDGDGDTDMLVNLPPEEYDQPSVFFYLENIGTPEVPNFAVAQVNPFGLGENTFAIIPRFADLDSDGDQDLMACDEYGFFYFYENTGSVVNPTFATPVFNPFNLTDVAYAGTPNFADFDNDGDLDLLSGESGIDYGNFVYFENVGTATAPEFTTPVKNPFGLQYLEDYNLPTISDMDFDGDVDVLTVNEYGEMFYFKNTGTVSAPQFADPVSNPFGISDTPLNDIAFITLVDIDNDKDIDLMCSEAEAGNFRFYENTANNPVGLKEATPAFALKSFPNPIKEELFLRSETALAQIEIIDLLGRPLLLFPGDKTSIDLKALPAGVFLLRATDRTGNTVLRKIQKM